MGILFEKIYHNEVPAAACERMMRCLGRKYWMRNEAISTNTNSTIEVFSKNGECEPQ